MKSLINKNMYNYRTSDDIGIKLGPANKLDKKNTATSKNDKDVVSSNYNVIIIFPIYGKFGGIRKLVSKRVVCNFYIFIIFYFTKTENRTKNLEHSSHIFVLSKGTIFATKMLNFCQKIADTSKVSGSCVYDCFLQLRLVWTLPKLKRPNSVADL